MSYTKSIFNLSVTMVSQNRQSQRGVGTRQGAVLALGAALVLAMTAGCSRSMGEFEQTSANPILISPVTTGVPAPGAVLDSVPPIALAPEEGAGVATLGPAAAQLPVGVDPTVTGTTRKRLLTPEEKARIIAELEALARQQANY